MRRRESRPAAAVGSHPPRRQACDSIDTYSAVAAVARIMQDLGLRGRAYVKAVNGRAHLILQGRAGLGFLAALGYGVMTTMVAGPLIAGIVVSLVVGSILGGLDEELGVTETPVAAIQERLDIINTRIDSIGNVFVSVHRFLSHIDRIRRRISRSIDQVNRFRFGLPRFE